MICHHQSRSASEHEQHYSLCALYVGIISNGRALALHVRGSGIDTRILHTHFCFAAKWVFSLKVSTQQIFLCCSRYLLGLKTYQILHSLHSPEKEVLAEEYFLPQDAGGNTHIVRYPKGYITPDVVVNKQEKLLLLRSEWNVIMY